MQEILDTILVVGAGISGIRSALDLAIMGYSVKLIDKANYTGGTLVRLDHQFPDDSCGICRMLPLFERDDPGQYCLRRGVSHDNMEVMRATELIGLEGEPGRFTATLRRKPTMVDRDRCIGCGRCADVCPVVVPKRLNDGLTMRKAIYLPLPYDLPNNYVVDLDACTRCGACQKSCPTKAVDLSMEASERQIGVGAVILAAGFGMYSPAAEGNYCYHHPNVVTSLEFERLMSPSGPNQGRLLRPGDGKEAERVAWLQCVGSRDHKVDADFCSSACCMYSIKQSVLAKEFCGQELDAAIFYMDMRTYGKNFQSYRDRAQREHGVRFVRSRIHSVEPSSPRGDLNLTYVDQGGGMVSETFDLVVLAVGQRPAPDARALAEITGISLTPQGFVKAQPFSLTRSSREGIFASGSFAGLRDISESVIAANGASLAASLLLASRGKGISEIQVAPAAGGNRDRAAPRVYVAIWACGEAMWQAADLDDIVAQTAPMSSVGTVRIVRDPDPFEGSSELKDSVAGSECNRLLICSCVPNIFAGRLRQFAQNLGLEASEVEVIDLRPRLEPEGDRDALRIRGDIVSRISLGVDKLSGTLPWRTPSAAIEPRALVIGGGIAGLTAALAIANHGFPVHVVEKTSELGGNLLNLRRTLDGGQPQRLLAETIAAVIHHRNIRIHKNARVVKFEGQVGRFATTVMNQDATVERIGHGVTIVATGGREAATKSYCFGQSERIVTQGEFERKLDEGAIVAEELGTVAMVQCVDSREKSRPYCSRICCATALKNALYLKEKNPGGDVFIFYRDLMSYGFIETYYTLARQKGVVFIPYGVERKPGVVVENGAPVLTAVDPILGREFQIRADMLVLSTGVVSHNCGEPARVLGLKLDKNGFYQEEESKWRPVDLSRRGVFGCGLAHSPRNITESIAMAQASALRSLRFLSKAQLSAGDATLASVDPQSCMGCRTCVDLCEFQAISFDDNRKASRIDEMMCQGCGVCAAACPVGAISVGNYTAGRMIGWIEAMLAD
ncbi:MAG: FAD-dependent oxidoreductase [Syntrophobacteraceae bacterium]|nr:FAD-dependent oxidoreductase [Syntrophobacteraceae bacterium]